MTNLYYYYDKEADVLYISQGKPSPKSLSREADNDVIIRVHPKTGKVVGFTILNFSRRLKRKNVSISLPIQAELIPA